MKTVYISLYPNYTVLSLYFVIWMFFNRNNHTVWLNTSCYLIIGLAAPPFLPCDPRGLLPIYSPCVLQSCASALLIVPLPWPVTVPLHDIPICRRAFLQFTIHLIERCFRWFHPNQSVSKYTIHIHALMMTENSVHTLRPLDALQMALRWHRETERRQIVE